MDPAVEGGLRLSPRIVLLADLGRDVGWGHFRECLSIGEALRERGFDPLLLVPEETPAGVQEAKKLGFACEPVPRAWWTDADALPKLSARLRELAPAHLLVDLFEITPGFVAAVGPTVSGLANVTELHEQELAPLNFNICQAPEYMPLHARYRRPRSRPVAEHANQLLVCFGGADPKNVTGLALEMLRQGFERGRLPPHLVVTVVVGPLFEHGQVVAAMPRSFPAKLQVVGPLPPEELAALAEAADLAVTTGGGTMYEFCALGLPTIVVPILDKMDANARVLEARGAVVRLDRCDRVTADALVRAVEGLLPRAAREGLAGNARHAIDGRGAERIVTRLVEEWKLE